MNGFDTIGMRSRMPTSPPHPGTLVIQSTRNELDAYVEQERSDNGSSVDGMGRLRRGLLPTFLLLLTLVWWCRTIVASEPIALLQLGGCLLYVGWLVGQFPVRSAIWKTRAAVPQQSRLGKCLAYNARPQHRLGEERGVKWRRNER